MIFQLNFFSIKKELKLLMYCDIKNANTERETLSIPLNKSTAFLKQHFEISFRTIEWK